MNKRKIPLFMVALACLGCCAVPIYALVAGVISVGSFGTMLSSGFMEVWICLMPLMLIAGFLLYRRHQQKRCCPTPGNECSDSQCGIEPKP